MGDCGDRPVTPRYHPSSPLCGVLDGVGGGVGGQRPPQKTKYDGACRPAAHWGSALHRTGGGAIAALNPITEQAGVAVLMCCNVREGPF